MMSETSEGARSVYRAKRLLETTENAVSAAVVVKAKREKVNATSGEQRNYTPRRRTNVEDTDEEADMSAGELYGEEVSSHGSVTNRLQEPFAHQTPQRTSRAAKKIESKNTPLKHKVGSLSEFDYNWF